MPPCTHTLPSRLLLAPMSSALPPSRPFLLHLLFLALLSAALSSLLSCLRQVLRHAANRIPASPLFPGPQPRPRGAGLLLGVRQRGRSGASPPPSLPPSRLASSLAVKRVEKNEKRKLVTPEYAQRKVGKHLLNTDPREALGSILYRQNPNLRGGQLVRGLHRCGSPT